MTTDTQRRTHTTEVQTSQLAGAQQLLELLEAESTALQMRQDEKVADLAERKQRLVSALENDHSPCPPPAADETARCRLRQCLEQCQRLNFANGQLVARRRVALEYGLQILRGVSNDEAVYNAHGQPARNQTARQLGSV